MEELAKINKEAAMSHIALKPVEVLMDSGARNDKGVRRVPMCFHVCQGVPMFGRCHALSVCADGVGRHVCGRGQRDAWPCVRNSDRGLL